MNLSPSITAPAETAFAVPLVCPRCKGQLAPGAGQLSCNACAIEFRKEESFWNFIVGGTFEDELPESQKEYESNANADTVTNYWLPLFRRLWPDRSQTVNILSVGCGVGKDVDVLCQEGFNCVGIDCGHRNTLWEKRDRKENMLLANGKFLPFESGTFDAVFCGCVFPHVGVEGDSNIVAQDHFEQRSLLAGEMARVLRRGGKVVVSSPNRWFPADIFHGRTEGKFKPRVNLPTSRFLLSPGDYAELFGKAGCGKMRALPVRGYWGFIRSRNSIKGRLLGFPVRVLFRLADVPALRRSPLNPWIVVMMEKMS
jgi:SAM-dependent methyltransferase